MEDDGTDGRALVKASDVPDMENGLSDPHVDPAGKTVVFTGSTSRNKVTDYGTCGSYPYTYPCWTWHYGFNATGVYTYKNGQITRDSAAPAYCYNCTMSDYSPELSGGADRYGYAFVHCQGTRGAGTYTCNSALQIRGEGAGTFGTVCGEGDFVSFDAAINPKNASQIAYADCTTPVGDEAAEAVYVAEPGRANEHPVACDDATISDPSFSADGTKLVTSEGGTTPGLWIYDPSLNNCQPGTTPVHAVVNPDTANISFADPRFMGTDKLVFTVGTKSGDTWSYDLYTVPASCNACAFPSAATKLTEGGLSSSAAWTAASLAVLPPAPPADSDGDGVPDSSDPCPAQSGTQGGCPPTNGNGGTTNGGTTNGGTTDGGTTDGGDRTTDRGDATFSPPAFLRSSFTNLLKTGLPVRVGCTPGCSLSAVMSIPGKLARKLGLTKSKRAKNVTVGKRRADLPEGGTRILKIQLSPKAAKAFRKHKRRLPEKVPFTVNVTGVDTEGATLAPVRGQLRLKR